MQAGAINEEKCEKILFIVFQLIGDHVPTLIALDAGTAMAVKLKGVQPLKVIEK